MSLHKRRDVLYEMTEPVYGIGRRGAIVKVDRHGDVYWQDGSRVPVPDPTGNAYMKWEDVMGSVIRAAR